jgi:hypothetical protein
MGILDKLPAIIAKATSKSLMRPMVLHVRRAGYDVDGLPSGGFVARAVRGLVLDYSDYRRTAAAIPETDVLILLLQHEAAATPTSDDELEVDCTRYAIVRVTQDPARATWSVQARPRG